MVAYRNISLSLLSSSSLHPHINPLFLFLFVLLILSVLTTTALTLEGSEVKATTCMVISTVFLTMVGQLVRCDR